MNYNFDQVISRRRTNSVKYDFAAKYGMPEDILPLWVADMDFPVASGIQEALRACADHGIFGYTEPGPEYIRALQNWYSSHFGFSMESDWVVKTPGVVYAIVQAIRAFTAEGDSVLIQQPVYYPFARSIEENHRRLVNNPLCCRDGHYTVDFRDFEDKILKNQVKLFVLCSPHNPVGRVWSREELQKMGEICRRHQVLIVADEIHSDFVYPGHTHTVFGALGQEFLQNSVICTAPSKTFNLAGLQVSNIIIANPRLRALFQAECSRNGYSNLNAMGLAACQAAYESGQEWLEQLKLYLQENLKCMKDFLQTELPQAVLTEPEGTYLVWVDFSRLGYSPKDLDRFMSRKAKVWLDGGTMFGPGGEGFQRFNIACPRSVLMEGLTRIASAL
ncbi:MalY/PatB family protein [Lactonifactor longoviformis]|uniref:MalY/PatB family protein n=1 Tax=Lactonifactor longoviformis TaxID=341220 RepID=UPI001D0065F9|nr:MalY/PatB family protein [Lactonifactor longoviformis]MCB5713159.1 pyridoxal phosphate-dependent aminotransferase [Lactonifactor longoviformis]MCB5717375.1 pyridoxal phosphate-dependent aminotransferase [Lactonifactor longoviformis]